MSTASDADDEPPIGASGFGPEEFEVDFTFDARTSEALLASAGEWEKRGWSRGETSLRSPFATLPDASPRLMVPITERRGRDACIADCILALARGADVGLRCNVGDLGIIRRFALPGAIVRFALLRSVPLGRRARAVLLDCVGLPKTLEAILNFEAEGAIADYVI